MQDFQVLLGAAGIIQHAKNAWSSYSSVAAMMNAVPLLNTWITGNPEDNSSKYVGALASFDSIGGVPAELKSTHRKQDVRVFMDMMFCEWDAFKTSVALLQSLDLRKNESKKFLLQAQARMARSGVDAVPLFFPHPWTCVLVLFLMLL
jgi:hypothetical protein